MSCVKKYFLLLVLNLLPDNFMECLLLPEQKEAVTDHPLATLTRLLWAAVHHPYHPAQMSPAEAKKSLSI